MGRATYEAGYAFGAEPGAPSYTEFGLVNYVFGRELDFPSTDQIHFVRDDVVTTVTELKKREGLDIWLCGGAALARTLLDAGLIDQVVLKQNPVWFGAGIPLFRGEQQVGLRLTEARTYPNGVGLLRYTLD